MKINLEMRRDEMKFVNQMNVKVDVAIQSENFAYQGPVTWFSPLTKPTE